MRCPKLTQLNPIRRRGSHREVRPINSRSVPAAVGLSGVHRRRHTRMRPPGVARPVVQAGIPHANGVWGPPAARIRLAIDRGAPRNPRRGRDTGHSTADHQEQGDHRGRVAPCTHAGHAPAADDLSPCMHLSEARAAGGRRLENSKASVLARQPLTELPKGSAQSSV